MTPSQLIKIRQNLESAIDQVNLIFELQKKLHAKTHSPYYEVFGKYGEKEQDLLAIQKEINEAEIVLNGMLK
jgi:hypothetical protein